MNISVFLTNERTRAISVLIVAQMICLASGLWLQYRLFISSMEHAGREDAWRMLATELAGPVTSLRDVNVGQLVLDGPTLAETNQKLETLRAERGVSFALVDQQWRLRSGDDGLHGQRVPWTAVDRNTAKSRKSSRQDRLLPVRGKVITSKGQRAAIAFPTRGGDGYVLAYRLEASTDVAPSAVYRSLFHSATFALIWTIGLLAVAAYLVLTPLFDKFAERRAQSDAAVSKQAESMARMRDAVIFGLVKLTESRDPDTGYHLERIALYSSRLATALRRNPEYRRVITPEFVKLIEISSILHDIGKVGVEDRILLKPGRLTSAERKRMQQHAEIGGKCLRNIEERLGRSNFLQMAREIAFSHHERWDGDGYPQGMKGAQIPLAARIVAVCDVYEALSSKRIYKEAFPHEECVGRIREEAGQHFDPQIVETFLQIDSQFREIAGRYANPAGESLDDANATEATDVSLPVFAAAQIFDSPTESSGPTFVS